MQISLIHFLNFCLGSMILFPASSCLLYKKVEKEKFGHVFTGSFIFLSVFFYYMYREVFSFTNSAPQPMFVLISVLVSIICIASESLIVLIKNKKFSVQRIKTDSLILLLFVLLVIPVMEEFLFRRYLFAFFQSLDVHISIIIILSSVAFGLNHLVYSKINVLTKMIWGCMFALLYYYTDNIFYPIFSHVLCNIIVFIIGKV